MFNSILARASAAMVFFWAGLHLIGWGMIENGSAHPRNLIWQGISALFTFEIDALKFLGWIALTGAAIFVTVRIVLGLLKILGSEESPEATRQTNSSTNPVTSTHYSVPAPHASVAIPTAMPLSERLTEKTTPLYAPTPEELKKKAIEQILKGY